MIVKPSPGLKVRDPDLRDFIPATGRTVPDTPYWIRRLRDKDIELVTTAPAVTIIGRHE